MGDMSNKQSAANLHVSRQWFFGKKKLACSDNPFDMLSAFADHIAARRTFFGAQLLPSCGLRDFPTYAARSRKTLPCNSTLVTPNLFPRNSVLLSFSCFFFSAELTLVPKFSSPMRCNHCKQHLTQFWRARVVLLVRTFSIRSVSARAKSQLSES